MLWLNSLEEGTAPKRQCAVLCVLLARNAISVFAVFTRYMLGSFWRAMDRDSQLFGEHEKNK